MDLDRFLNLIAALLGAVGAVYVLKSVAALSPDVIERLSRTYWDFSVGQIDSITAQKADAIVGIALVLLASAIGITNEAFVPESIRLRQSRSGALFLAGALAVVAYFVLAVAGSAVQAHQKRAVVHAIVSKDLSDLLAAGKLPTGSLSTLRVYAHDLLGLSVSTDESARSLLNRVAQEVGFVVPENLDYSEVEPAVDRQVR